MARRQFDGFVKIDAPLEGGLMDWPANIQDGVFKAVERLETEHGIKLEILHVSARCDDPQEGWFIHIVCIEPHPLVLH